VRSLHDSSKNRNRKSNEKEWWKRQYIFPYAQTRYVPMGKHPLMLLPPAVPAPCKKTISVELLHIVYVLLTSTVAILCISVVYIHVLSLQFLYRPRHSLSGRFNFDSYPFNRVPNLYEGQTNFLEAWRVSRIIFFWSWCLVCCCTGNKKCDLIKCFAVIHF
jgi:hypothetical protein